MSINGELSLSVTVGYPQWESSSRGPDSDSDSDSDSRLRIHGHPSGIQHVRTDDERYGAGTEKTGILGMS